LPDVASVELAPTIDIARVFAATTERDAGCDAGM